jgi:hypothetical protein
VSHNSSFTALVIAFRVATWLRLSAGEGWCFQNSSINTPAGDQTVCNTPLILFAICGVEFSFTESFWAGVWRGNKRINARKLSIDILISRLVLIKMYLKLAKSDIKRKFQQREHHLDSQFLHPQEIWKKGASVWFLLTPNTELFYNLFVTLRELRFLISGPYLLWDGYDEAYG